MCLQLSHSDQRESQAELWSRNGSSHPQGIREATTVSSTAGKSVGSAETCPTRRV